MKGWIPSAMAMTMSIYRTLCVLVWSNLSFAIAVAKRKNIEWTGTQAVYFNGGAHTWRQDCRGYLGSRLSAVLAAGIPGRWHDLGLLSLAPFPCHAICAFAQLHNVHCAMHICETDNRQTIRSRHEMDKLSVTRAPVALVKLQQYRIMTSLNIKWGK